MNNLFIFLCILFLTLCTSRPSLFQVAFFAFFYRSAKFLLFAFHTTLHRFFKIEFIGITNKLFQLTMQKFSAFEFEYGSWRALEHENQLILFAFIKSFLSLALSHSFFFFFSFALRTFSVSKQQQQQKQNP